MTCIKIKEYVRVSIGPGHHIKGLSHFVAVFFSLGAPGMGAL